jgi:trehalose 6-phosphate synthase
MNLVAKEFVAARSDENGALILSKFTGAAAELKDALLINPYDTAGFAAKIKEAIEMPDAEKRRRMGKMRRTVAKKNIYKWGADIVSRLMELAK